MVEFNMDKLKELNMALTAFIKLGFRFCISIVEAGITLVMLFGSFTSMYLLYLLFPEESLVISNLAGSIFTILIVLLRVVVVITLILATAWIILFLFDYCDKVVEELKDKRKKREKKFYDRIVIQLKKRGVKF